MPATPRHKKCSKGQCASTKIDDANKAICCGICQGWFHTSCVSLIQETADIIKNDKCRNIIWKCDSCTFDQPSVGTLLNKILSIEKFVTTKFEDLLTKFETFSQKLNDDNQQSNPPAPVQENPSPENNNPTIVNSDIPNNDTNIIPNDQFIPAIICSYYKKGICRHGSTGKKIIDGHECKFSHPRKCLKFCRYGSNSDRGGCSGPCSLLHPTLCKSSQIHRTCFSTTCTLAHLSGTKRSRDLEQSPIYNGNNFYPHSYIQKSINAPIKESIHSHYQNNHNVFNHSAPFVKPQYQQDPVYAPIATTSPDYYTTNQVTSILKQIQSSFDSLLPKPTLNHFNQQSSNNNMPYVYREDSTTVHPSTNHSIVPNQNGPMFQPSYAKNFQAPSSNPQPQ